MTICRTKGAKINTVDSSLINAEGRITTENGQLELAVGIRCGLEIAMGDRGFEQNYQNNDGDQGLGQESRQKVMQLEAVVVGGGGGEN